MYQTRGSRTILSSIVPSVTISKVGGLSSSNEINYKSYRRQGSDSPAIFFTLPFSFTLDFVFTLTLAYDSFDFDFNSYLSFHYLALIGFKPLLRRYDTVLSLDISSYHSPNFNEKNFLPSVKSAFVTRMINLD